MSDRSVMHHRYTSESRCSHPVGKVRLPQGGLKSLVLRVRHLGQVCIEED